MESLGTALFLLVQFWGATGLRVQQEPEWLQATQGSPVTLACQVIQSQIWERLRVEWTKDGVSLCEPHITNGSLSLGACGPRGQLSWKPPDNLTLRLDHVSLNDSGNYVCSVTVEIPRLNTNRGNGTHLLVEKGGGSANQTSTDAGLPVAPLVAGGVAVAAIALSAWVWGRCRSRREDSASQPPAAPGPEDLPQPQVESPYIYCRRLP